jgi:hypothetical protein
MGTYSGVSGLWGPESPAPSLRPRVTKSPNPLQRRAPLQKSRRPESPDPRAGVSSLAKVPRGSGPKLRTKMAKTHFGPESPALEKGRNSWNQNDHNLNIRTPFSMILGSLESQQLALQLYAEKHHSPIKEDKTKSWKVWPFFKDESVKPPNT